MGGWFFILFEVFAGGAGSVAASGDKVNKHVKAAFSVMRFIVTVGWSIYPLGYVFGYLMGAVDVCPQLGVQPCRFREQDRILPCHLGVSQERHCRAHEVSEEGLLVILRAPIFAHAASP